jgi:hypothetical protein
MVAYGGVVSYTGAAPGRRMPNQSVSDKECYVIHSCLLNFILNAGYFKKSFTTLKAYINLFIGHVQCFELSQYSKIHQVLPEIVTVQCDFQW